MKQTELDLIKDRLSKRSDHLISTLMWDFHQEVSHRYYTGENKEYLGFYFSNSGGNLISDLNNIFAEDKKILFKEDDYRSDYIYTYSVSPYVSSLNLENIFYNPDFDDLKNLEKFLDYIAPEIEERIKSRFAVVNVRAWLTFPGAGTGPFSWHTDGLGKSIRKVLIYLNPPNIKSGTTALETPNEDQIYIQSNEPGWLLLDSSVVSHRGLSPIEGNRKLIEIIIVPSLETCTKSFSAGLNATFPLFPSLSINKKTSYIDVSPRIQHLNSIEYFKKEILHGALHQFQSTRVNFSKKVKYKIISVIKKIKLMRLAYRATLSFFRFFEKCIIKGKKYGVYASNLLVGVRRVNIGGGPDFLRLGWRNLEEWSSPPEKPFKFSPTCSFPFTDNSIDLVYSSHVLEHLDEDTVKQVLNESLRILKSKGKLIIIIPNYDLLLESWKRKEPRLFSVKTWAHPTDTWGSRGLPNTLNYRAAYVFCGFWNQEYGHGFSGVKNNNLKAYNGPPVVDEKALEDLLKRKSSPAAIARELRNIVVKSENSYTFNHQSAWGKEEFIQLIQGCGFEVLETDPDKIINQFSDSIQPYDREIRKEISLYVLAQKK